MMTKLQKTLILSVIIFSGYVIFIICKYWYSDYLYAQGKNYNSAGRPDIAIKYLVPSVILSNDQPVIKGELAISYALLAQEEKDYIALAEKEINSAVSNSPNNLNLIKTQFGIFIRLLEIDPKFALNAKNALDRAIELSPNDPKLYYNLGLLFARGGNFENAVNSLNKAIELKPNYEEPKKALDIIREEK